jgi:class 3 adenylate cyclase
MQAAIVRHDALAALLIPKHGGTLVKSRGEGDSLFAVFARATDAVTAACALQRAFVAGPWPEEAPLRVRMALHTGEANLRDGDYFGPTLNRCARLRAIAHGGQILLSAAAREQVASALPERTSLREMGAHRLKDLSQPERVWQLLHPDLPTDFPPLQSLNVLLHNLPIQNTSIVGREAELVEIERRPLASAVADADGCGRRREEPPGASGRG